MIRRKENMKYKPDGKYLIVVLLWTAAVLLFPVFSMGETANQHIKEKVKINDLTFDYEIIGSGKPVIMVHGFGVDREVMRGCMETIFKERPGWKRIYFDLPGMGKTNGAKWIKNSDDMLDVTRKLIKKLCPGEKYLLVGESYGGYICRGIVYKEPGDVLGMILICPLAVPDDSKRDAPKPRILNRDTSLYETLSPYEKRMFDLMVSVQTKRIWDRFNKEMMSGWQKGEYEFLTRIRKIPNYAFSFTVDQLPVLFDKPSLIFTGRQDAGVGYRDIWNFLEQYPRATFVVLDMAGHALQIEQETLFNALVHDLLDRVENKK
jgi:pimeloyl-ACP methyl ester carboxylesterase